MKDNKGFTFIELVATIAILGVVVSMTIFAITSVIKSSKEKSYKVTINNIESVSANYVSEFDQEIFWERVNAESEKYCVSVRDLIETGYFNKDILSSNINDTDTVMEDDYIYIERNSLNKSITLKEFLVNDEDVFLKCNKTKYLIRYELDGGVAPEEGMPSNYMSGEGATITGIPTKTGYMFKGWASSGACFDASTPRVIEAASAGNKVFYACFDPIKYNINYWASVGGGWVIDNLSWGEDYIDVELGDKLAFPEYYFYESGATITGIPTKEGHYFTGYATKDNCSDAKRPPIVIPPKSASGVTYRTCFRPATYSISYYNGDTKYTNLSPTSYVYATGATLPIPTKEGYMFKGWCETNDNNCSDLTLGILTTESGNKTYYATWEERKDNMYSARFYQKNYKNGNVVEYKNLLPFYYTSGKETKLPIIKDFPYDLVTPGYVFVGWCDSSINANCNPNDAKTVIASSESGDKVYYAAWAGGTFNITYDLVGGSFTSTEGLPTSYLLGTGATISGVPVREGYAFQGWRIYIKEVMEECLSIYDEFMECYNKRLPIKTTQVISKDARGDYDFAAVWEKSTSDNAITYYINSRADYSLSPKFYKNGDVIDLPVLADQDGKKFIGWCESSNMEDCLEEGKIVTKISASDEGDKSFRPVWEINKFRYLRCDSYYVTKCVEGSCQYTSFNNIDGLNLVTNYIMYDKKDSECTKSYCTPVVSGYNKSNKSIEFRTVDANLALNYGIFNDTKVCETKEVNSYFGNFDVNNFNPLINGTLAENGKCNVVNGSGNRVNVDFSKVGSSSFCNIDFVYKTNTDNVSDMDNLRYTNCTGYDNPNYEGTYYCLLPNQKVDGEYLPLDRQCALATTCVQGDRYEK